MEESTCEEARALPSLQSVVKEVVDTSLLRQQLNAKPTISGSHSSGFVHVAQTYQFSSPPIQLPASGSSTLIESLSVPEPENLQVANTLVDASKTCFLIQVVNPSPRDV